MKIIIKSIIIIIALCNLKIHTQNHQEITKQFIENIKNHLKQIQPIYEKLTLPNSELKNVYQNIEETLKKEPSFLSTIYIIHIIHYFHKILFIHLDHFLTLPSKSSLYKKIQEKKILTKKLMYEQNIFKKNNETLQRQILHTIKEFSPNLSFNSLQKYIITYTNNPKNFIGYLHELLFNTQNIDIYIKNVVQQQLQHTDKTLTTNNPIMSKPKYQPTLTKTSTLQTLSTKIIHPPIYQIKLG